MDIAFIWWLPFLAAQSQNNTKNPALICIGQKKTCNILYQTFETGVSIEILKTNTGTNDTKANCTENYKLIDGKSPTIVVTETGKEKEPLDIAILFLEEESEKSGSQTSAFS